MINDEAINATIAAIQERHDMHWVGNMLALVGCEVAVWFDGGGQRGDAVGLVLSTSTQEALRIETTRGEYTVRTDDIYRASVIVDHPKLRYERDLAQMLVHMIGKVAGIHVRGRCYRGAVVRVSKHTFGGGYEFAMSIRGRTVRAFAKEITGYEGITPTERTVVSEDGLRDAGVYLGQRLAVDHKGARAGEWRATSVTASARGDVRLHLRRSTEQWTVRLPTTHPIRIADCN